MQVSAVLLAVELTPITTCPQNHADGNWLLERQAWLFLHETLALRADKRGRDILLHQAYSSQGQGLLTTPFLVLAPEWRLRTHMESCLGLSSLD